MILQCLAFILKNILRIYHIGKQDRQDDRNNIGDIQLHLQLSENEKMGTNEITGDISVSEKKALVLSVPYSKGFTAYVDGKETKLQKANTMFMALELEPGSHEIRLTYCTPYLKAGMLLSVLGLVIYVMLVFRKKK